jgi:light-regulated signal transduction histidine kinase (bacteriophytochrome)
MIDSLLSFSRLGKKELSLSVIDTQALINEIIEEFTPDLTDRKIKWNISPVSSIRCDRGLMKLAFENLISNAIKYTSKNENAEITIESKTVGNNIQIYFKDNGIGFDMAYVDKLFGVFQRLHLSSEFEGVGIGLANVKRIVQKHNGQICAEGKVNEGATFYISLPI